MKPTLIVAGMLGFLLLSAGVASAGGKTYQVTGPVLEVTDTIIAVQKGKDRWEILRDSGTKLSGDLKVGAKATVEYKMTATTVEVKPENGAVKKKK